MSDRSRAVPAPALLIRGGRVIDPVQGIDRVADLAVSDGRILSIGEPPPGFVAEQQIDAQGWVVAPGFVDLAVRPREPGDEQKATLESECRAALAGGITTLCMPPDTRPPIDTPAVVRLIEAQARAAGAARVVVLGALTQQLAGAFPAEMAALRAAGCVGMSNGKAPLATARVLRHCMEYAASNGLMLFVEPEEPTLAADGCAHEGEVASRLGLTGIPASAESIAIATVLLLVEQTGARVHFGRLSAARSVALIAQAKAQGLPVTADVAAHQLIWNERALLDYDARFHLRPPLRGEADRQALLQGVLEGVVDAICSDHQPHEAEAKLAPFAATEPGISALETLLPLALAAASQVEMPLIKLIERLSSAPARLLGLDAGSLLPGARADLCLFAPDERWRLSAATLHSRGQNSPLIESELVGRVRHTLLDGRIVHQAP